MNRPILKSGDSETSKYAAEIKLQEIVNILPDVMIHLENFTVHDGWLGVSLFYCFYARYTDQEIYLDEAAKYLNKALEMINPGSYNREYPNDSYDYRLASLGAFFQQVKQQGFLKMEGDDFLTSIDQTLTELARIKIVQGNYSRFSGALASGHYFYNDSNNPLRVTILSEIIYGLMADAKSDADGDLYWSSAALNDKIYFGPHGSAMIISFLSAVLAENIEAEKCKEMLAGAARFVRKQVRDQKYGLFPIFLGEPPGPTQFSQCYGDLGVGYALFRAAKVLDDQELLFEAQHILAQCADRRYEDGHTLDASITYGAAGVAHLFDKLARLSDGNEDFLNARDYWFSRIPDYATFDNEFSGFKSSLTDAPAGVDVSFGWGIIGIGISLMKFLKPDLPDLDGFSIYV